MKVLLYVFSISFLVLKAAIAQESNTPERENISGSPNFILIMADDLGYGDLSCYGNDYIKTPHIDKLADEGIRFTDFHSNGPVCSPTRAALLTGKYQQRTGVNGVVTAARHRDVGMAIDEITIADELKSYGYTTGIFGKWHLGYASQFNPTLQGFDTFKGYVSGNVDYQAHIDQEGHFDWWNDVNLKDDKGYTTDLITQYGIDFINENNPGKTGKPFFLYLPHESPHYPYQSRNDKSVRKVGVPGSKSIPQDSISGVYKEMIEILDEGVGRIMQTLKETGLDKNTIVIFCSDNGASKNGSNGLLRGYKGSVYEGGHRVPAIAWHSSFQENFICDEPVLSMDFLPTFLDFINKKPKDTKIDGISIKKLLLKGENLPKRDLFWEFKNRSAVRSGRWKLIVSHINGKKSVELYDLSRDISEVDNVIHLHPNVVKHLLQKLKNWHQDVHHGVKVISD